jgi:hypothetical protein
VTAPTGADQAVIDNLKASMTETYTDLLTYGQAQDVLGISRYTLSRLIREGRLTKVVHAGKYYVTHESMTAYIRKLRRPSAAPRSTDVERRTA